MYSELLCEEVRQEAFIGDAVKFPDFTNARLMLELDAAMQTVFADYVVRARQAYWQQRQYVTTVAGVQEYPVPLRSVVGGIERIELVLTNGRLRQLTPLAETYADDYDYNATAAGPRGMPAQYVVRGDQFVLFPAPDSAYSLRVHYFIRPSVVKPSQLAPAAGAITSIGSISSRVITFNAPLPTDYSLTSPIALQSGNQFVDIVHREGWHELAVVSCPQTFTGTGPYTMTLGGTDPLNRIRQGDLVRCYDQTDFPALPDDFHRTLAQVAAVQVLHQLDMNDKAASLAQIVSGSLARFANLLEPRIKSAAPVAVAPPWVTGNGDGWG